MRSYASTVALAASLVIGCAIWLGFGLGASAQDSAAAATAITQVFGDGQKLTALAIPYDKEIVKASLSPRRFMVQGRTVTRVYANIAAMTADEGVDGQFVIVEMSPDDADAPLYVPGKGPGAAPTLKLAKANAAQIAPIKVVGGGSIAPTDQVVSVGKVVNLVADDFRQLTFKDPKTGDTLNYNLFIPKEFDKSKSYPLVLFMHDAGATSADPMTTLAQGLGAISFATPEDQAKHPAFVLAPQYSAPVVDENSQATSMLDTTVDLVEAITSQYGVDAGRIYATGQSEGAMMSIAMDIKHPDLFAATLIVAGQWDPALVAPLAKEKLWIIVSQGDEKAYPGENSITAALEKAGAKVERAVWDGRPSPAAFADAVKKMKGAGAPINYVALQKGTGVPPGQTDDPGANHVNTWRIAYAIGGVRDWLFEPRK